MSALLHWFTTPEWTQLVKTLLHSLWQGALITVVLALTMRRLTNPLSRYRCSLAALTAIPVAAIITWATLNVPQAPLPAPAATPLPIETALDVPTTTQTPAPKVTLLLNRPSASVQFRWSAWLALVWLIGAIAMLGRAGVKVAGAERLRRTSQPLDNPQIAQLVAEAKRAVGVMRQVRIAVTDRITSPAVVGVIVPTLILPLTLMTTLTPEQIRFILLHELAHIRRGDYFANLFQLFVESLLFFNPAVWWISHQVRREREACCDALAIELSGAPADYARTLVHVAENILNPAPEVAPAFGNEREPSSLADRVQRLLVPGYRPALRLTWRAMITAFVLGGVFLVLSAEGTRVALAQINKPIPPEKEDSNAIIGSNKPSSQVETAERFSIGDPITLTFAGTIDKIPSHEERIKDDGTITLPLIGTVTAAGKTAVELQKEIHNGYVPAFYKQLTVTVAREESASLVSRRLRERQSDFTSLVKEKQSSGNFDHGHSNQPPTRMAFTNERQRVIADRLNQIILEDVEFNAQPLSNVVRIISTQAKQRDPQGHGVNIIINPPVPSPDEGQAIDIGGLAITINPALTKVRLGDALDAILMRADRPLKLSIEDYAVVISLKGNEPIKLFMREFKLDPATFVSHLAEYGYRVEDWASRTNFSQLTSSVRSLFASMGVDLDPTKGKSVFYHDRRGILLVRATKEELDVIEAGVQALNRPEPQVNIKVRFVEVPASLMNSVSKDFLGTNLANLHGWTSILTKPQGDDFLKHLKATQGVGFLSEGEVTTLSGRQAQLQIVDLKQIITGINPLALTPPGITSTNDDVSAAYQMQLIPLGPIIDVIASVSANEDTIQLTSIPSFTEFLGYSSTNVGPVYVNGRERAATLPLPILRTRQATHKAIVWDGQTVVLGNPAESTTFRRSDGKSTTTHIYTAPDASGTNILLVLVTPTVVDPAGNRLPPSSKATKNEDIESFQTSTNLRPIIDRPILY